MGRICPKRGECEEGEGRGGFGKARGGSRVTPTPLPHPAFSVEKSQKKGKTGAGSWKALGGSGQANMVSWSHWGGGGG